MSLKYFRDAFSGIIFTYNTEVTPIINSLFKKIKSFPNPHNLIFSKFLVASDLLICAFFGIGKENADTQKIIGKVDIKKFREKDFRKVFYILITYYSYLFYQANEKMEQDIKKHLFTLTQKKNWVVKLLKELGECEEKDIKTSVMIQRKVGEVFNMDENNSRAVFFLEGLILNFNLTAILP